MIHLPAIQNALRRVGLGHWAETLPHAYSEALKDAHGNLGEWQAILRTLPRIEPSRVRLDLPAVTAGDADTANASQRGRIQEALGHLHPWRKGPFSIHGVEIDSEWRSNLKWDRVRSRMAPLKDRLVLDVGAGNGYYAWRMAGEGAGLVIGVEPNWLYLTQFLAVRHFIGEAYPVHLLPFGIEQVPPALRRFDTVFSMGVFYHRRSPMDHLLELKGCLRPGGELVLETLVIEGEAGQTLVPEARYAKMPNVWFLPSVATLEIWLKRCGYRDIRCVDVTPTTAQEQRATAWMRFESLGDFLDPADPARTLEGYPAPLRAVMIATAG